MRGLQSRQVAIGYLGGRPPYPNKFQLTKSHNTIAALLVQVFLASPIVAVHENRSPGFGKWHPVTPQAFVRVQLGNLKSFSRSSSETLAAIDSKPRTPNPTQTHPTS